jgi:alpha-1,3-rhamnosyl/mannosyltransferase
LGADSLLGQRAGIGRLTLELARALRDEPEVGRLLLWMGGEVREADALESLDRAPVESAGPAPNPIKVAIGQVPGVQILRRRLHRRRVYRRFAEPGKAGERVVYHETNMIPKRFHGTTVVHMHDLSWHHHPELHPKERIAWIDRNLSRMLRQTARFVSVSEFTAAALSRDFNVPRSRIDVVASAASPVFRPYSSPADAELSAAVLRRHDLQDRSYIFSVSTLEPRKNFDRLLAAHMMLPLATRTRFPLVIAGGAGWGKRLANEPSSRAQRDGTLRLLGFMPDHEVAILTARAAVFPYVSLYEGFGLPVLEAMRADTPVIASSTTAVGETAGTAAILVDPLDVDDIARALRVVLEDRDLAADLRQRGLVHSSNYTWSKTARGVIGAWNTAVS